MRLVAAMLALGLIAAACGDDGGGTGNATNTGGSSSGSAKSVTTTVVTDTPVKGGTVTIALFSEVKNLDPLKATGSGGSDGNRLFPIYGALVTYDPVKAVSSPLMAESFKATDAGFTKWTLKLKPNQKFSDGTAYDAAAIKANWERAAAADSPCACKSIAQAIASMTLTDPLTVDLTLKSGNATFDNLIARNALNYIASPKAITDKVDLVNKPVGAGPFRIDEWIPDGKMTLSRNPDWTASPGPYVDKLVYVIQSNEDQRVTGMTTGQFDGFYTATPSSVATAQKDNKDATYASVAVNLGQTFVFNTTKAPFDDIRVRKAVIMAIPRDVLAKDILLNSIPADYFALKGSKDFSEASALPKYDAAGAQKLIDEYVKEKGPITFTMVVFQQTLDQARAKFIQTALDQLKGIKAELAVGASGDNIAKITSGKGDFQWTSWGFPTTDPNVGLYNATHSGQPGLNPSNYNNATVDKALEEARLLGDPAARAEKYKIVYEQLAKDLPFFPYTITTNGYVYKSNVKGGVVYEDGIPRVDLLWFKK